MAGVHLPIVRHPRRRFPCRIDDYCLNRLATQRAFRCCSKSFRTRNSSIFTETRKAWASNFQCRDVEHSDVNALVRADTQCFSRQLIWQIRHTGSRI